MSESLLNWVLMNGDDKFPLQTGWLMLEQQWLANYRKALHFQTTGDFWWGIQPFLFFRNLQQSLSVSLTQCALLWRSSLCLSVSECFSRQISFCFIKVMLINTFLFPTFLIRSFHAFMLHSVMFLRIRVHLTRTMVQYKTHHEYT